MKNDGKIDFKDYGLTGEQAAKIALLDEKEMEYAYRLVKRKYQCEDAESSCEVLLSEKPDLLDELTDDDYGRMAALFDQRHVASRRDDEQMEEACLEVLKERFPGEEI